MPTDDNELPQTPVRRINTRRSRGGFSSGVSTQSESLRTSAEGDEVDDVIDPGALQQSVIEHAGSVYNDTEPPPLGDGAPNPRQRMNEVMMAGSQSFSREYRLTLLHRMLIRRVPLDQIAKTLKVSVSTIEKDRALLKKMLRENARALNIDEMIGNQQEVYSEIAGMALRIASDSGNPATGSMGQPTAMRLAAMRTALAAEADRTRFLANAGVFDVLRFRRTEEGSDVSDVQLLMEKTNELMERMLSGEQDVEDAPKAKPRRKIAGFKPFSMDDKDASGSSDEVVDI